MGHSVGLVLVATRVWFIHFCIPPKDLGDPGSSRGTLERVRVDLTLYIARIGPHTVFPSAGKAKRWWEYMNSLQTHECGNWDSGRANPFLGIFGSNFR